MPEQLGLWSPSLSIELDAGLVDACLAAIPPTRDTPRCDTPPNRADRGMCVGRASIGPMALSGAHVVRVSEIPSKRWDLALEQLDAGGAMTVLDGEPLIGLQRYFGWPGADGQVLVSVFTALEPHSLTQEIASSDVAAGLQTLSEAVAADPRLAALLQRRGVACEYVFDYGHGAVAVAVAVGGVDVNGSVTLH